MKIRKKIVRTYHCNICSTGYKKPEEAKKCERRAVEMPVAKIGDTVSIHESRICMTKNATYTAKGRVVEVAPPMPPDEEYENKWLGGKRVRKEMHTRQYVVRYKCTHCREDRTQAVYAPEFTVLKSKNPETRKNS